MENSLIQWTDHTFSTWQGCSFDSEECWNCYAMVQAARWRPEDGWGPHSPRLPMSDGYWKQPLKWNRAAEKEGRRRRVFCNSISDLFERVDVMHPGSQMMMDARRRLWALILATPWLDWLLLTKRPQNMNAMVPWQWAEHGWPDNVWAMTSAGNEKGRAKRLPALREVKARVRGVSIEPMLEGFSIDEDLRRFTVRPTGPYDPALGGVPAVVSEAAPMIHWAIIGGESGSNARPFDVGWAEGIIRDCRVWGCAPFLKQLGAKPYHMADGEIPTPMHLKDKHGGDWDEWPEWVPRVREFPITALPLDQPAPARAYAEAV